MLYQVHLQDLIPEQNYYRLLDKAIDFHFLYKATSKYYGEEGQESIDPVVFFKICLVGYLNNINSDRKLIEYCSNCLDVRLFIRYDIDEALPWHSTISRTRQLYGEEVFLTLFKEVLKLCVSKGMIRGKRQAVDSVFIKANASYWTSHKFERSPLIIKSAVSISSSSNYICNFFCAIHSGASFGLITSKSTGPPTVFIFC